MPGKNVPCRFVRTTHNAAHLGINLFRDSVRVIPLLADIPARARPITDETERRPIIAALHARLDVGGTLDEWLAGSPLVEVELEPGSPA